MIGNLVIRATQYSSLLAAAVIAPDGMDNSTVVYIIRGAIALGFLAFSILIKKTADTIERTNRMALEHEMTLRLHNVMFENWLASLTEGDVDHPARRETDRLIAQLVKEKQHK